MWRLEMASMSKRIVGKCAIVVLTGLAMVGTGCGMTGSLRGTDLPRGLQAVGGGFMIDWDAPMKGTVYLVERTSGKVIETRSLDEGESYDFSIDADAASTFENALGIPLAEARLVLYWKPANP
jgi:hypothetical protein